MTKSAKLVTVVPANPAKGLPALKAVAKPRASKPKTPEPLVLTGLCHMQSKYNGLTCVKLPFLNSSASRNMILVRVLEAPAGHPDTLLVRDHEITSPSLAAKKNELIASLQNARQHIQEYLTVALGFKAHRNDDQAFFLGGPKVYPKIHVQVYEPDENTIEISVECEMTDCSERQELDFEVKDLASFQKEFSEIAVHVLGQYEHEGFHSAIAMFKSAVISKPAAKKRKK